MTTTPIMDHVDNKIFLRSIIRLGKKAPLPQPMMIVAGVPLATAFEMALKVNRQLKRANQRVWTGFWLERTYRAGISNHVLRSMKPEILQPMSYFGYDVTELPWHEQRGWGATHGFLDDSNFWQALRSNQRVYNLKTGQFTFKASL